MMSPQMDAFDFVTAQLPSGPARVLEVGCGHGRLARALDERGYQVVAIDPAAPEGAIFQSVSLAEFADPTPFDAVVASRRQAGISRNAEPRAAMRRARCRRV
jgi:SAM-dependent methyltransferase